MVYSYPSNPHVKDALKLRRGEEDLTAQGFISPE